jgi:hypothetical protein
MNSTAAYLRFRWLQLPTGLLIMLLQRTPAPLLRALVQLESVIVDQAPMILRTSIAAAAMGAYNSVAGATVFNVTASPTAASPTSGAAKAAFAVNEASGAAVSVAVSVSGAPGNPKSYSLSGALPAGLSLTGATGTYVNVTAPYKMTIAGTPTASGSFPVRVTAWDGSNGTGGNSAYITLNFTISGGVSAIAPSITTQPSGQTVTAGTSVSFSVAASGTPSPTYQWQKNGADLAGATSTTLSLSNVQSSDAGSYTAVATNSAGSATSSVATLTVNAAPPTTTAPSITSQPSNQSVTVGGSATFSVAASGNPTPTYQWQKGGANIAGATGATLSLSNVQTSDAGSYTAVATNSAGSVSSSAATLTVTAAPPANTAPTITTQPTSQSVTAGASVTFSVSASGNPTPTYQWQKGGANIAGATSSALSLSNVQSADAGSYTAVATNSAGSVSSSAATLTVTAAPPANTAPTITAQPASLTVAAGSSATFSVTATGNPAPTYQWKKGATAISGATNASYTIASVVTGDAATYTVVATNSAGSVTSSGATLTVSSGATGGPALSAPLAAQTVTTGHAVSYTAQSVTGTYQWQVSSDSGATWSNLSNNGTYSGATARTLTVTGADSTMNGYLFRYLATDSTGTSTSSAATLTVASAFLPFPTGIVLVGSDTLYVTDSTANTVQKVTTAGDVTAFAGAKGTVGTLDAFGENALFNQPGGVTATAAGVLFIADTANATIRRIGTDGSVTTFAGSTTLRGNTDGQGTDATFSAPLGVAVDSAGSLYVADATNHTIRKISPQGAVSTFAGAAGQLGTANGSGGAARFNYPAGVAIDAAGNVFIADRTNNLIRKITAAGAVSTFAGVAGLSGTDDGTGSAALFNLPSGLVLDSGGNLYVADTGNCTIRKITAAGAVSTLAGLPTVGGDQDGTGYSALFSQPRALTIDSAGNLYVADTGNAAIRKVTPAGVVTTLTLRQGTTSTGSGATGTSSGSTGSTSGGTGTTGTTPAPSTAGGGGGGGAPSTWFIAALGSLSLLRWAQRSRRSRCAA